MIDDIRTYRAPADLLAGRVVLVTGAAGGIGRTAALTFARHGASVILAGRRLPRLEKVYDEIVAAGHPEPALIGVDLAQAAPDQYEQLAQTVDETFGRLDGLLHNAAELGTLAPLVLYDLEVWQRVLAVNLHAPLLLTRACLPLLERSKDASVIFTSADVGRRARAYWGAYAVSQFALEGMAQVWADELVENTPIRINTINPGSVRTAFRAQAYPLEDPRKLPLPETLMPAYLYLMGGDSRGVTGRQFDAQ